MQEQDGLNAAQRELERALRSVAPTASQVDPVAAAFSAGRAAGRRQMGFWRAAAVVALTIGIGIRLLPAGRNDVTPQRDRPGSIVVLDRQSPAMPALPDQSVLMLQRAVEKQGVEGMPAARLCPVQTLHAGDVL